MAEREKLEDNSYMSMAEYEIKVQEQLKQQEIQLQQQLKQQNLYFPDQDYYKKLQEERLKRFRHQSYDEPPLPPILSTIGGSANSPSYERENNMNSINELKESFNNVTLHGNEQHGNEQHGNAQHGNEQHGNAQHGNAQHGNAQHGNAQHGNAQHGNKQTTYLQNTSLGVLGLKPKDEVKGDSYATLSESLNLQLIDVRQRLEEALKNMSSETNIQDIKVRLDILDGKIREIDTNLMKYNDTIIHVTSSIELRIGILEKDFTEMQNNFQYAYDEIHKLNNSILENANQKKERPPSALSLNQLGNIKIEVYKMFQEKFDQLTSDIDTINTSLKILQTSEEACNIPKKSDTSSSSITHGDIPGILFSGYPPSVLYNSVGAVSCNGEIYMAIENFPMKKKDARCDKNKKIYSSPFYSSGYKMRMLVYPNGDHHGKDKYVSVYFVIIKGENDEILTWPFSGRVECNLHSYGNFVTLSENFIIDSGKDIAYTRKPVRDMNKATGLPVFATHAQANNALITNDTLVISMKVKYEKFLFH